MANESGSARIAAGLTWQAALRAERMVSSVRLVFCTLVLLRFVLLTGPSSWQSITSNVSILVTGILCSIGMLHAISTGRVTQAAIQGSSVLDSLVCFGSLLQTTLWPSTLPYQGIMARPDAMTMVMLVGGAGYRMSATLALLSGLLNGIALAVLIYLERVLYGASVANNDSEVFLFGCVLAAACALSVATARRTRSLVEAGASASAKVERARFELAHVLRDQHDARSLLNAATLHAGLIDRALDEANSGAAHSPRDLTGRLLEDLSLAANCLQMLGERTFGQLAGLDTLAHVDLAVTAPAVIATSRLRFPRLKIDAKLDALPQVRITGGAKSLERVLFNLILNAEQGDGVRCATAVCLTTRLHAESDQLCIEVSDDGPGFHPSVLGETRSALSTKRSGSGLGLLAISSVVEQSGGRLTCANAPSGARVQLYLPIAT